MSITAIAAIAQNRAIGKGNQLPWRLPADLQFFKKITSGHIILMGRKSFDSIGKALPNRQNWVLTKQTDWSAEGVQVFSSVAQVLEQLGDQDMFVIGGGEIYSQMLPLCQSLYLTRVATDVADADAFFPEWNTDKHWVLEWEEQHLADQRHAFDYCFQRWIRR